MAPRLCGLCVAVVLGIAVPSRANSPWVLHAGAGVGIRETEYRGYGPAVPSESSIGPVATADIGVRLHSLVGFGLHVGAQQVRVGKRVAFGEPDADDYLELEAGVSVQASLHRFSVLPWIGVQSFDSHRQVAGGVTVGYDVLVLDRDRIGLFASGSYGGAWSNYYAACVGVGYRFW